jgi:hypothetical protein
MPDRSRLSPSELNRVARLVLIAERCGPDFLDNAEGFDSLLGRGRFADTDGKILDAVRGIVKTASNRLGQFGI